MGLGRYQKGTLENCSEHFRARARGLYTVNLEGEEAAGVLSGIDCNYGSAADRMVSAAGGAAVNGDRG